MTREDWDDLYEERLAIMAESDPNILKRDPIIASGLIKERAWNDTAQRFGPRPRKGKA